MVIGRAANYCRTSDNVRLNLANVRAKVILIGHWSDKKKILSHYTFCCCDKIRLRIHSICILQQNLRGILAFYLTLRRNGSIYLSRDLYISCDVYMSDQIHVMSDQNEK